MTVATAHDISIELRRSPFGKAHLPPVEEPPPDPNAPPPAPPENEPPDPPVQEPPPSERKW